MVESSALDTHFESGTGDDTDLCRTQVTIALSSGTVGDLLTHPLGNHLVLNAGNHERRLRAWWNLTIADQLSQ